MAICSLVTRLFRKKRRKKNYQQSDEDHVAILRQQGVTIGEACRIYTSDFSTEPYLVSIGNRVGISGGVKFLTHDGAAMLLRSQRPKIQSFGRITVGDGTFIGENAILLPGTEIGDHCIVGAGAVVRGHIPRDTVVIGNPAVQVGRTSMLLARMSAGGSVVDSFETPEPERRAMIIAHFGARPPNASLEPFGNTNE